MLVLHAPNIAPNAELFFVTDVNKVNGLVPSNTDVSTPYLNAWLLALLKNKVGLKFEPVEI